MLVCTYLGYHIPSVIGGNGFTDFIFSLLLGFGALFIAKDTIKFFENLKMRNINNPYNNHESIENNFDYFHDSNNYKPDSRFNHNIFVYNSDYNNKDYDVIVNNSDSSSDHESFVNKNDYNINQNIYINKSDNDHDEIVNDSDSDNFENNDTKNNYDDDKNDCKSSNHVTGHLFDEL